MNRDTISGIQQAIAKGWKPNLYLTNMSMAYFAEQGDFVAPSLFPVCPVSLSSSYYYKFTKADLARDNVRRKPAYGKVQPAIMGQTDDTYKCEVDQVLVGIDQISTLDYSRSRTPGVADPRRAKVRFASEQMMLHNDRISGLKLEPEADEDTVLEAFRENLRTYYVTAKEEGVVRHTRVCAVLSRTTGVVDFDGLTMNGDTENINILTDGYPVTGEVKTGE